MAWIEGVQKRRREVIPEQEWERQFALEGFLEEDIAKKELFKFFKNNLTVAANILMGVDLFPYQSIVVKTNMDTDYVLDILGRGSGKTWLAGVFAGLYALFNPGVKVGILAPSFRQARRVFEYIEEIASKDKASLFAACISKIEHKNDQWSMKIGDSIVYALPLGMGEKLRGFRFNCIVIDELLLMPNKIINEVIIPFLGVVQNPDERAKLREAEEFLIKEGLMTEDERYLWKNNKLIGLSSASYAFEYLFELYKVYENLILGNTNSNVAKDLLDNFGKNADATRAIVHMSYEAVPQDIYDKNLLEQAIQTMSESQFAREFKSVFTDDSSGFFRISKMKACTVQDGEEPSVEVKGDPAAEYILAIDPSWAENDTSDDFAIQVLKLNGENQSATLVHSYAVAGAKLKNHITYFLYLLQNFNIVMIWMDYAGGVQFVNSCNESEIFKQAGIQLGVMEEEFEPNEHYLESVAKGKREYSKANRKYVVFRKFSSDWIRKGNELLQSNFDHQKIWFGAKCFNETYSKQISQNIPIDDLDFLNDETYKETGGAKKIDLLERQHQLIDLTKTECALIQVRASPQGTQVFDLPENIKRGTGPNRTRKDSYTALTIGSWGCKVYFDMLNSKQAPVYQGFTPTFIR